MIPVFCRILYRMRFFAHGSARVVVCVLALFLFPSGYLSASLQDFRDHVEAAEERDREASSRETVPPGADGHKKKITALGNFSRRFSGGHGTTTIRSFITARTPMTARVIYAGPGAKFPAGRRTICGAKNSGGLRLVRAPCTLTMWAGARGRP